MDPFGLPTPPLTRGSSPVPPVPLPAEINAATRRAHTELNRLIIDRLPLAVPPTADSPSTYGLGLAAFAQIYFVFEESWEQLESSVKEDQLREGYDKHDVRAWLASLRPDGLSRSERLHNDLMHMGGVETLSETDDAWKAKLQRSLAANPHTLVAYAWVMYMAIFSGGRWIRQQLENAGPEFWNDDETITSSQEKSDSKRNTRCGRSFLYFPGDRDGEDIKTVFKTRLAEGEHILTADERNDIILAAQELFDRCIYTVRELDAKVAGATLRRKWPYNVLRLSTLICLVALIFVFWIKTSRKPIWWLS